MKLFKKRKPKELVYFAEDYLNNALRFLEEGDIETAKDEIKWALRKSGMRIYDIKLKQAMEEKE